jgi:hypothetical protein
MKVRGPKERVRLLLWPTPATVGPRKTKPLNVNAHYGPV